MAGCFAPSAEGELGPRQTQCGLGQGLPHTKWHLIPSRRLAERTWAKKGELGPHLTQCGQVEVYLNAKFHLDASNRLATIHRPDSGLIA